MGGVQSSQFVPEADTPGGAALLPPPQAQQAPSQPAGQQRRRATPDTGSQRRAGQRPAQAAPSPPVTGEDAQRQIQLLTRKLRSCIAHVNSQDDNYHRETHELKYQLANKEDELEKATQAQTMTMVAAGGVGLALLCAGAAGGMLARRSILAEQGIARELEVRLAEL